MPISLFCSEDRLDHYFCAPSLERPVFVVTGIHSFNIFLVMEKNLQNFSMTFDRRYTLGFITIFFLTGIFFSLSSVAVEKTDDIIILNDQSEAEVVQKIKTRSYSGGFDESDLKVQTQLFKPQRKIAPTAEESSDPGASSSQD